jgi:acyl carrier protein
MDQQALLALIAETVRTYALTMHDGDSPVGPDTQLFGPSGVLDSIGLVSVVVELEQALTDRVGRDVSLMNDRAMSQTRSPFLTVRSLAEYAMDQLPDSGAA